jgi:hypothetical protein
MARCPKGGELICVNCGIRDSSCDCTRASLRNALREQALKTREAELRLAAARSTLAFLTKAFEKG